MRYCWLHWWTRCYPDRIEWIKSHTLIEMILSGNFAPTFPAYWEAEPTSDTYNGAVRNRLLVSCINGNSGSEDIIYTLTNLST